MLALSGILLVGGEALMYVQLLGPSILAFAALNPAVLNAYAEVIFRWRAPSLLSTTPTTIRTELIKSLLKKDP